MTRVNRDDHLNSVTLENFARDDAPLGVSWTMEKNLSRDCPAGATIGSSDQATAAALVASERARAAHADYQ